MGTNHRPGKGNKRGTMRQVWRDVTRNGTSFRQRFYVKDKEQFDAERDKVASLSEKVHELAGLEKLHGIYDPGRERILHRDADGKKFALRQHLNPDGSIGGWVSNEASVDSGSYVHEKAMVLSGKIENSFINKETVIEIDGSVEKSEISDSTLTGKTDIANSRLLNSTVHDSHVSGETELLQSDVNDSILESSSCYDSYMDGARVKSSEVISSDVVKGATVGESDLTDSTVFASIIDRSGVASSKVFGCLVEADSRVSMSTLRDVKVSSDPSSKTNSTLTGVSAAETVEVIGSSVELTNMNNVTVRRSNISNCSLGNGSVQDLLLENSTEIGQKDMPFILAGRRNKLIVNI